MQEVNGITIPFRPINRADSLVNTISNADTSSSGKSFDDFLTEESDKIKFSRHAQSRLTGRELGISADDLSRLATGFGRAAEKGANESLIMVDDKAFIVSVPNRTVITVLDKQNPDPSVITNIDSAVLA